MNGLTGMLAATRRGLGSLKVVMATGLYKTAAGVVGQRIVKENAGALRGYLTVQLRSAAAAEQALAGIEDTVEHGTREELSRGPSKRAALFLAARNVVEYERLFGDGATEAPLHAVPWEPTAPGRIDGWGRALDELRFGLGGDEAEILQLHHACGLSVEELAYVLAAPRDEIQRRIEAGAAYARLLLEDVFGDERPQLEQVLKEAYATAEPTPEQRAAARPKVVPLPRGTLIGDRYEIQSTLGGGEFAYVYQARDVRVPGHVVALKLLHRVARTQAAREGAMRELSLIASAFHPSLVQFKDHGWFEDRLWFVMPFYRGELLLDRLERGPLPLHEGLDYFERLARALAALHAAGIRHQDIKPENIFLVELSTGAAADRPEVLPVLLDLGVASPSGEMALAGTPMYFAPEIAARIFDEHCELPLTPKADVFALALSLLHSLEEPDLSDLESSDIDAFLRKRVRVPPSGPRGGELKPLRGPFARWLAADPSERPSAGELADEIAELRAQLGADGSGRRRAVAPRGLRTVLVGAAMSSLLLIASTSTDVQVRPLQIAPTEAASTGEGAAHAAGPPAEAASESDRLRLLRERLRTEERRGEELEEELERLRRHELELPAAPTLDEAAREGEEAPGDDARSS